jgi:hypothetical protein
LAAAAPGGDDDEEPEKFEEQGVDLPLVLLDVDATLPKFWSVADADDVDSGEADD